jgi:hypothetical protein
MGRSIVLTTERKLVIATAMLKYIFRKKGVHLTENTRRELGGAAKAMGIPVEEVREFAKPLIQELLDEQFK